MYHPITFRKIAGPFLVLAIAFGLSVVSIGNAADEKAKKKPAKRPNPAMAKVEDVAGLPRVLLVGDSISIGYTVPVRTLMAGKANVHRPLANCGPTTAGLAKLSDSVKYNEIAAEIMKASQIEIHDLYTFAKERQAGIQKKADVHFSPEGSEALADDVVRVISAALEK